MGNNIKTNIFLRPEEARFETGESLSSNTKYINKIKENIYL